MKEFNERSRPAPPDPQKELVKLITGLAPKHGAFQVFNDFVEMGAIAIASLDRRSKERREQRYMEAIKRYPSDEQKIFPQMLSSLVMALEANPSDVLGETFHDLELHNKYAGQFFTPFALARLAARMTMGDDLEEKIAARGFVTASEPAVGAGAMMIALAQEMFDRGINYQKHLHVTAVDVDVKCVHMAYLQASLLHIPAVIVHGNSLTLEEFDHWYTPAHILDGWSWRLGQRFSAAQGAIETVPSPEQRQPPATTPPSGPQLTLFEYD